MFPGTGFVHEIGMGKGEGFNVNVPLPSGTDDPTYLWAFHQLVPQLLERFQADIVVTQLGVDTHRRDPLANLVLTTAGLTELYNTLDYLATRWLAVGGGGYDIRVVPRAWTLAFGVMSGQFFPNKLPPQYRSRYGGMWLRDQLPQSKASPYVKPSAESLVAEVKRIHHLR